LLFAGVETVMSSESKVREANLRSQPLRDLKLSIEGTPLAGVIEQFRKEMEACGVTRVKPHFYLSTEWGVPFGTISIAIPFYLARVDLTDLHSENVGFIEGANPTDILRYLRHEMGHVINYAYQLYEQQEWVKHFGAITQPYVEEYRPQPFSPHFVMHLPGWYAQKHPDEDWAETFAVWMTPGLDWRRDYAGSPVALGKLEYCDRTLRELRQRDPLVTAIDPDEDVTVAIYSLEEFYHSISDEAVKELAGVEGGLRAIFEEAGRPEHATTAPRKPAGALIRRLMREIMANVYRWTGHFPERTLVLLRQLASKADELKQVYPEDREVETVVALTAYVTALAMNHVHGGSYMP
jgi:hypothetical protein